MPLLDSPAALAWTRGAVPPRAVEAALDARRFARRWIAPAVDDLHARLDADHAHVPWDLIGTGARAGWLSAAIPRPWGGRGLGIAEMSAAIEEMCAIDAGVANIFGAHGLGMLPIMLAGDVDLAERILGRVARSERSDPPELCAFAITEPGGGSDVEEREGLATGDVRTRARPVARGYRITGRKVFISNGNLAAYVAVFAALDPTCPAESWTAFLVRRGAPGLFCARTENKMGQRACPAAELVFDDVFVPAEDRIGGEGTGAELSRRVLAVSRGPVGAIATGCARGGFEAALAHARSAPSPEPWVDDALARMAARIRAARAAYMEAAVHCDAELMPSRAAVRAVAAVRRVPELGPRIAARLAAAGDRGVDEPWAHQAVLGAAAKITGSDTAMAVTTEALDIVPPTAGALRARAERAFCDAKLTQIYEGTNQINARAVAHESWRRSLAGSSRSPR